MAKVLIIDDEELTGRLLCEVVMVSGHTPLLADNLHDGLFLNATEKVDVVYLDVNLPDGSGLDALSEIKASESAPEVIILTGYGNAEGAEMAMMSGAWDYIAKPASFKELTLTLMRALQYRAEKQRHSLPKSLQREGIVGESPSLSRCLDIVAQAAATDVSVLITGETGTGKELFARAIHNNSARRRHPIVVVDCTALPETLAESLLFGHIRGAFTGADRDQVGLIKQADHGTLFLDEVAELPLGIQKSFLRVLQERRFRPIGGRQEVESNFRLVSATNRDMDRMVAAGRFREDLLFRLRSMILELPPLRERPEDIRDIAMYYLGTLSRHYERSNKGFSPDFFEVMAAYEWPGNVRELMNTLAQVFVMAGDEPILYARHLPDNIRAGAARASWKVGVDGLAPGELPAELPPLAEFREQNLERLEGEYLIKLMDQSRGDIDRACATAGLSRSRLYTLLRKYGLSTPVRNRRRSSAPDKTAALEKPADSKPQE